MSEIKNTILGLYGTEHLKSNHVIKLGSKGLKMTIVKFRRLDDKHLAVFSRSHVVARMNIVS